MTVLLTILDVLAALCVAPVALWLLDSRIARHRGRRVIPRSAFRALERWTRHHTDTVAYLAFDWLLLRGVWAVWGTDLGMGYKLSTALAALALAMLLVHPFLRPFSVLFGLFARTPPLHIDRAEHFPESAVLEDPENWGRIRAEVAELVARSRPPTLESFLPELSTANREAALAAGLPENAWRSFWLKAVGASFSGRAELPALDALLRPMDARLNTVFLSILEPGVSIDPHRGPYRGLLRYHLGLIVPEPEKQYFECAGTRYHWREGEGMLFDPVCTHRVESAAGATRVILIIDVPRRQAWPLDWLNRAAMFPGRWHPFFRRFEARARGTSDQPERTADAAS